MTLTFYAHPLSHFSQKALIALYELDLPFTYKFLESPAHETWAEMLEHWSLGKFPVLVDGAAIIAESSLIVEHLDGLGGGRLLPSDPVLRGEARLLDRIFDSYVATPQSRFIINSFRAPEHRSAADLEEARAQLDKSYAWLDKRLTGRPWAAGDQFTLADCAAAPMLFYADWFHPIAPSHQTLNAYIERVRGRASVARAIDEARPYRHLVPGGIPAHIS